MVPKGVITNGAQIIFQNVKKEKEEKEAIILISNLQDEEKVVSLDVLKLNCQIIGLEDSEVSEKEGEVSFLIKKLAILSIDPFNVLLNGADEN